LFSILVLLRNSTEFVYLGSLLTEENDGSKEIQRRIARATEAIEQFGKIWRSAKVSAQERR